MVSLQCSLMVKPLAHNQVYTGSSPVAAIGGDGVTAIISVSKTEDLSSNLSPRATGSARLFSAGQLSVKQSQYCVAGANPARPTFSDCSAVW